jgi:hypothetical protein
VSRLQRVLVALLVGAEVALSAVPTFAAPADDRKKPSSTAPLNISPADDRNKPAASFLSGSYQGTVQRRQLADGKALATRSYTLRFDAGSKTGYVYVYENQAELYQLKLIGTMTDDLTFIGGTKEMKSAAGGQYNPDVVKIDFSKDGKSLRWYYSDGSVDGSGTLSRQ